MARRMLTILCVAALAGISCGAAAASEMDDLITRGDLAKIAALVKATPAALNALDETGFPPLCFAIESRRRDVVLLLLKLGADVSGTAKGGTFGSGMQRDGVTALHVAAYVGDEETVKLLLDRGADVNAKSHVGDTALRIATQGIRRDDIIKLLKARGARPDLFTVLDDLPAVKKMIETDPEAIRQRDGYRRTPLHCAVQANLRGVVVALVEAGADLEAADGNRFTPLGLAVEYPGREDIAAYLISKEAGVNWRDVPGRPCLVIACSITSGNAKNVKALLDAGADPDATEKFGGGTALHAAAERDDVEVARVLLQYGARADIRNEAGLTPLDLARNRNRRRVAALLEAPNPAGDLMRAALTGDVPAIKALIEKDSRLVKAVNGRGETALHVAARTGMKEAAELLIDRHSDVKAVDGKKRTPLHTAAAVGNIEIAKMLLARGAPVNAKDASGETPLVTALDRAAAAGPARDMAALLIAKGADVNIKDNIGVGAIFWPAASGDLDTLKLLVEKGADVRSKDNDGRTPLHDAAANVSRLSLGDPEPVVTFLLSKGADVNAKDKKGRTPLWETLVKPRVAPPDDKPAKDKPAAGPPPAVTHNAAIAALLIEKGADVNAPDAGGIRPLRYVMNQNYTEMIEFLKAHGAKE